MAYRGLETGDREVCSHVIRQNKITWVFQSPLNPTDNFINPHLAKHGDGVRDVAFEVDDAKAIYERAIANGAKSIKSPWEESDQDGKVVMATIGSYGDVVHTLIQRNGYKGVFLPGYVQSSEVDPLDKLLPDPGLRFIDHVVGNQPED